MKYYFLGAVTFLMGCNSPEMSSSGPNCSLADLGWRPLTFSLPPRVAAWNVKLDGSQVVLNEVRMSRPDALNALSRAKNLRPSPYTIIRLDGSENCNDVEDLAGSIAEEFDCRENYCFFTQN